VIRLQQNDRRVRKTDSETAGQKKKRKLANKELDKGLTYINMIKHINMYLSMVDSQEVSLSH
jgi:hypothetical protein